MPEMDNLRQTLQWAHQALQKLDQDSLDPTPNNYAIYYHLCLGDMPALMAAYHAAIATGKITQALCDDFYNKHFMQDAEVLFIKDASTVIDHELQKVMNLLEATLKGTDQFGSNLTKFTGALTEDVPLEALRAAVAKIAEETREVASQNYKLREELAATTTQLSDMRDDFDRVHKEAQIDPLTEVGNRKFFDTEMARTLKTVQTEGGFLSLLMIDIDHFKKFNDTHGHLIGDQVLRLVARTLVENLKGRDIIARYGGEEFVIVLAHTALHDAERVANQLRSSLAAKHIKRRGSNESLGVVTISLGAAEYRAGEDRDSFIGRADAALYRAKQSGRNKVVCDE